MTLVIIHHKYLHLGPNLETLVRALFIMFFQIKSSSQGNQCNFVLKCQCAKNITDITRNGSAVKEESVILKLNSGALLNDSLCFQDLLLLVDAEIFTDDYCLNS